MSVNFSNLLSKPLDDVKKPEPLPAGTYYGVITQYSFEEAKNEKKTPYVRYTIQLNSAGEDIDPTDLAEVDLSKRGQVRKDIWLSEDSQWRAKAFLESLSIETTGRTLGETLPEAKGANVLVQIKHRNSQDGKEVYIDVGDVTGA